MRPIGTARLAAWQIGLEAACPSYGLRQLSPGWWDPRVELNLSLKPPASPEIATLKGVTTTASWGTGGWPGAGAGIPAQPHVQVDDGGLLQLQLWASCATWGADVSHLLPLHTVPWPPTPAPGTLQTPATPSATHLPPVSQASSTTASGCCWHRRQPAGSRQQTSTALQDTAHSSTSTTGP